MLVVSGFDRCHQITRRFHDEDLHADCQPESTRIGCETSFLSEQGIHDPFEKMIRTILKNTMSVDLDAKFPMMEPHEAMARLGSDRPDLHVKPEFTKLTDAMKDIGLKVSSGPANAKGGRVATLRIPGGASLPRGDIDAYTKLVEIYGVKGSA